MMKQIISDFLNGCAIAVGVIGVLALAIVPPIAWVLYMVVSQPFVPGVFYGFGGLFLWCGGLAGVTSAFFERHGIMPMGMCSIPPPPPPPPGLYTGK